MSGGNVETIPIRDIIGNHEVRKLCGGITRHTLIVWRREADFPKPIRVLQGCELWDRQAVRAWYRSSPAAETYRAWHAARD